MPKRKNSPSAAGESPAARPPAAPSPHSSEIPRSCSTRQSAVALDEHTILQALVEDALSRVDFLPVLAEVAQKLNCPQKTVQEVFAKAKRSGAWEAVIAPEREVQRSRLVAQLRKQYDALHALTMELLSDKEFLKGILSEAQPDRVAEFVRVVREAVNEYSELHSPEELAKRTPVPAFSVDIRVTEVEAKRKELEAQVVDIAPGAQDTTTKTV